MSDHKPPRLLNHDYSQGLYFVTVCIHGGASPFGQVVDGRMVLNPAGDMVNHYWLELAHRYADVILDALVVMYNHFHGIVMLFGDEQIRKPILKS